MGVNKGVNMHCFCDAETAASTLLPRSARHTHLLAEARGLPVTDTAEEFVARGAARQDNHLCGSRRSEIVGVVAGA